MQHEQQTTTMENTMKQFEIGKRYAMNSICDTNCVWRYTVVSRTACSVVLENESVEKITCRINKKVSEWNNAETVYPLGHFSMCPILTAEKSIDQFNN